MRAPSFRPTGAWCSGELRCRSAKGASQREDQAVTAPTLHLVPPEVTAEPWTAVQPPALFEGVPVAEYHADLWGKRNGIPTLSRSIAAKYLNGCGLKAYAAHPLLGKASPETEEGEEEEHVTPAAREARTKGAWLHQYFLGGEERFREIREKDYRKDSAKQDKANALAAGEVPILSGKLAELREAAPLIRASLLRGDPANGVPPIDLLGENYRREMTCVWIEETPDGPVACRCRQDLVDGGALVIEDLKFGASAHPASFWRNYMPKGYDLQQWSYRRGIEACFPKLAGRLRFRFINVEAYPPYCWHAVEISGREMRLGELRWNRALRLWRRSLDTGIWPMYRPEEMRSLDYILEDEMVAHAVQLGQAPPGRPDPSWFSEDE